MSVIKRWNEATSEWEVAVIGKQGATGPTGPSGPTGDWSSPQTVRTISLTSDIPTASDAGKLLISTNSSPVTITLNSSLNLSPGQRIDVLQTGTGQVTFSALEATVNGTPGLKLRTQYSVGTVLCIASDTYVVLGDLSA